MLLWVSKTSWAALCDALAVTCLQQTFSAVTKTPVSQLSSKSSMHAHTCKQVNHLSFLGHGPALCSLHLGVSMAQCRHQTGHVTCQKCLLCCVALRDSRGTSHAVESSFALEVEGSWDRARGYYSKGESAESRTKRRLKTTCIAHILVVIMSKMSFGPLFVYP